MRVLVDILHPAHVHMFRNLAKELGERGHEVRFTLREKECARDLLEQYGLSFEVLSQKQTGVGLAGEFVQRGAKLWQATTRFRPHFLAGVMGPSIASVGRLRRVLGLDKARIAVFYGTEIAKLTNTFVYPMSDYVITPDSYAAPVRGNHITYKGYHELSYLHPKRFTPDPEIVKAAGVDPSAPYFVVRFVSYQASHDIGTNTLPLEKKLALVKALAQHGRVIVSSESELPSELEPHRLRIPASHIHHVLAFGRLLVGESATMAAESAVLGVPAVYVSPFGRGFTDDLERYGLVVNFIGERFHHDWVKKAVDMAADPELSTRGRESRERMLRDKIDVTQWMVDFFEAEFEKHFRSQ
jgi:predicted glycosyltransferase